MFTLLVTDVFYLANLTGLAAVLISVIVLFAWLLTMAAGRTRIGARHCVWALALICVVSCPLAIAISQSFARPFAPVAVFLSLIHI